MRELQINEVMAVSGGNGEIEEVAVVARRLKRAEVDNTASGGGASGGGSSADEGSTVNVNLINDTGDGLVAAGALLSGTGAANIGAGVGLASADGPLPFGDIVGVPLAILGLGEVVIGSGMIVVGGIYNLFD